VTASRFCVRPMQLSRFQPIARGLVRTSAIFPTRSALPMASVPSSLLTNRMAHRWFSSERSTLVVPIPEMGDSISEGTILQLVRKAGDYVDAEEVVAEIETDKVTVEARSPAAGTITAVHVEEGANVLVGAQFFSLAVGLGEPGQGTSAAGPTAAPAPAEAASPPPPKPAAAPAANPATSPAASPASPAPVMEAAAGTRERRVPMTRLRKRIATRLKDAQNTTAMLTTFNEIDMSALTEMRNGYKDAFLKKHDVKLGFMSAFVAASCKALDEQPAVNAVIDGDEILYRDHIDVTIAVSSPKGLVVPVLRDANTMTFAEIEQEIARLGQKAKDGSLSVEDMAGGTFSITNGGVFGSLVSTPIINPPQSAILGMHGIFQRPIAVKGQVVIRPMMYVALTYDHRLIDGREAVTCLKRIKELIEDPTRFLLDV